MVWIFFAAMAATLSRSMTQGHTKWGSKNEFWHAFFLAFLLFSPQSENRQEKLFLFEMSWSEFLKVSRTSNWESNETLVFVIHGGATRVHSFAMQQIEMATKEIMRNSVRNRGSPQCRAGYPLLACSCSIQSILTTQVWSHQLDVSAIEPGLALSFYWLFF